MKKIILMSLLFWGFLAQLSYGANTAVSQDGMLEYCLQNPGAMPAYCNNLKESVQNNQNLVYRNPSFNESEYSPDYKRALHYYQGRYDEQRWIMEQQKMAETLNSFKLEYTHYLTGEKAANEKFRDEISNLMNIQQNQMNQFYLQQQALMPPYIQQNQIINSEQKEDVESKKQNLSQEEIDNLLNQQNTLEV